MSDFNSLYNRAVWFDIPVVDLERAIAFYSAVLGVKVTREEYAGTAFGVLGHTIGNGGCLVVHNIILQPIIKTAFQSVWDCILHLTDHASMNLFLLSCGIRGRHGR